MSDRFRLIQDDMPVAGAEGPRALAEILHYAAVYSQDGPIKIQQHNGKRWAHYLGAGLSK